MDKRTVLALVLVAVVLVLGPRVFPNRQTTSAPSRTDSAQQTPRPDSVRTDVAAPPPSVDTPRTVTATPPATDSSRPAATPGQAIVVDAPAAEYRFSTSGGALESVLLKSFKDLRQDQQSGGVRLVANGTPLIRFGLAAGSDTVSFGTTAFAVDSNTQSGNAQRLVFRGTVAGNEVQLRYTIIADSFLVRVDGQVNSATTQDRPRFLIVNLPSTLQSFEADTVDDQRHLAYAFKPQGDDASSISFDDLDPGERQVFTGPLAWAVAKTKYFLVGVLAQPSDSRFAELITTGGARTTKVATQASGALVTRLTDGAFAFEVYTGPQQYRRLVALGREFENVNPYGGWLQGVIQPFATIVMKILLWMRDNLKLGYGWLLVIFGVAVRIALWPLNQKGMRTSLKMQRIQPELNEVQKRYKGQPEKLQAEIMRVYKEHDMSPFSAFTGCLPLFLPLPVFFALFFVFQNTIEFRGVPFLWLPDISQKDPFYIMPILMAGSMFLLSWIGMRNAPPNPQTKMMAYVFPAMMLFLFANFASGLNMYYAVQNIAALPQQWLIAHERSKAPSSKRS